MEGHARHGNSDAVFKRYTGSEYEIFWEIYDNPKKNRQLAENRFENAPLLEKVRKETALCILEYASRGLFEELGALAVVFYYGSSGYSCAAETEDLLAVLARRNYSYAVHCAFCLLALNFESIDDSCLPMLERVFTGIRRDWKPVERDGLKNAAAVIEKRSD